MTRNHVARWRRFVSSNRKIKKMHRRETAWWARVWEYSGAMPPKPGGVHATVNPGLTTGIYICIDDPTRGN